MADEKIYTNVGHATAYSYAKSKGYTGTEDEFAEELAQVAENAQAVREDREYVDATVEGFVQTTVPAAVQSVTAEGTTQIGNIQTAGTTQVGNVQAEGTTQVGRVTAEGTTQVGLVIAEGTTQKNAVTAKGQEVIESIPSDYTELTEEVEDLKSSINIKAPLSCGHNRVNPATVENGIIDSAETITINGDWKHTDYIEVIPNETLYVYGTSGANYCTYDKNLDVVAHSTNLSGTYIVPENVYFIRATVFGPSVGTAVYISDVNFFTPYKTVYDYVHEIENDVNNHFDSAIGLAEFTVIGFINKDYGILVNNADYRSTDYIPISGTCFPIQLHCKTMNTIALYAMYDANKSFLSAVTGTNSSLTEENPIVMPESIERASYIRITSSIIDNFIPSAQATKMYQNKILGEVVDINNVAFAEHDPKTNLIDTDALSANHYVSGIDGSLSYASGFYATDFIQIGDDKQYYFNSNYLYRGYCAFYNADKEFISGIDSATASTFLNSPFTPPTGTAYGRFSIASQANIANAWLCEYNRMATKPLNYSEKIKETFSADNPTDYNGCEISVFNKILCIGDSLTDGFFNENGGSRLIMRNRSYPAKLQALTGVECTNLGHSGYTSAQWYEEYKDTDLSGHDACIIQLGVNDALNNVSESDMDTALTSIVNKVKNDNNGIKIFIATIIPANGYMLTSMRTRSQMIIDFVDSLSDTNVYLLDMWSYAHTDDSLAYDAGHLSALGYLRLAEDYKAYISYVIRNNPDDFRYVQFIGTNYTYTGETAVRVITY